MTSRTRTTPCTRQRRRTRRAFTLAELAASMAIMVILMGAMGSVIMLAGQAIPDAADPGRRKVAAMEAVDQLAAELFYATAITEETPNAVTFTVADRGHGASGPETIRYAWSGTPGDGLTRQYNGGTAIKVFENVQTFNLDFSKRVAPLEGPPTVLFLVQDPWSITAQETVRQTAIESFGYTVQVFPAYSSAAEFDAEFPNCDVVYISDVLGSDESSKMYSWSKGVVIEKRESIMGFELSQGTNWHWARDTTITNNTHEITKPFALGNLQYFSAEDYNVIITQAPAPGGEILTNSYGYDVLLAVDIGRELSGGAMATGRRVALPWGDRTFDFNSVNENGLTIMRRAIAWAAAPVVYSGVRIALSHHKDTDLIRTRVQVYNAPKVSVP